MSLSEVVWRASLVILAKFFLNASPGIHSHYWIPQYASKYKIFSIKSSFHYYIIKGGGVFFDNTPDKQYFKERLPSAFSVLLKD